MWLPAQKLFQNYLISFTRVISMPFSRGLFTRKISYFPEMKFKVLQLQLAGQIEVGARMFGNINFCEKKIRAIQLGETRGQEEDLRK